jgi:phosphate transport system protein
MHDLDDKKGRELEAYLYASDKARLVSMVKEMAEGAGKSLQKAVEALGSLNLELAKTVIEEDDYIDEMEEQIDQECLYSIAMRQPMREDLRFVYAVMKIITDIERIGDQAVNIAMRMTALSEAGGTACPMLQQIEEMDAGNRAMLEKIMQAFVKEDENIIYEIESSRKNVRRIGKTAISYLMNVPLTDGTAEIPRAAVFTAMLILHHMGRISDHCLNLAEKVFFIVTGISPMTHKRQERSASDS